MRYLEDLHVGETFELGTVDVDRDEVLAFARRYDPQVFHVDEAGAAASPFQGIIASGWQTGAMFSRLCVDGLVGDIANLGGSGMDEIRFLAPVRPGDRLRGVAEIAEVRPSQRRPDRGTVTIAGRMLGADDAPVFTMLLTLRVARRPT